jgi:UDP:flavonoid glycosyltransferase YjiC (YdhE family)
MSSGCQLVVCDIAPLGIAVAEAAGLPSILVENFTWDWIYAGYQDVADDLLKYISILKNWFNRASIHIQTAPVCAPAPCTMTTRPVSRPLLRSRHEIRASLGLSADAPAVLITMGGIETQLDALERLQDFHEVTFIIPGGAQEMTRRGAAVLLPHHSGYYHPDLLAACDAVVGKLGYSTLAEACNAAIPFGFIPRARFRESPPLARFVREHMQGIEISEQAFASGAWLDALPGLLEMKRFQPPAQNGADQLADWMVSTWADIIAP